LLQKTLILSLLFSLLFSITANANTFRDVPSNHFALEAIRWVSSPANGSYMVGDASNNFNPGRAMDYFETAITLAMAAGFRYSPASITPADQEMFDRAYERHRQLLTNMASQHNNWRSVANREIAFLLELGIFTPDDLGHFITSGAAGTPAALSKQAATAFVMRLAGHGEEAASFTLPPALPFADDAVISAMYRRYAYLAHEMGIVADYSGYFSPHRQISRAEFAQMSHRLRIAAPGTPGAIANVTSTHAGTAVTSDTPAQDIVGNSPFASTLHGTVNAVQENSLGLGLGLGLQIATEDGVNVYTFAPNSIVVIDNMRSEVSELAAGMLVAAGLNGSGQIISLVARSNTTAVIPAAPIVPDSPVPVPPVAAEIPSASRIIQGSLIGRQFEALVLEDSYGNTHELSINSAEPYIIRNGSAEQWTALRIGDEVMARLAFGRLAELQAQGRRSSGEGTVEEIHITKNLDTIVIRRDNGVTVQLALPYEVYNIYELRLGMDVRVYIDSREIYELVILDETAQQAESGEGFIGNVQSLRHGHTMVVSREPEGRQTIRVDSNTINTATGDPFRFRDLRTHMRLYIVMQPTGNTAQSITILP